MSFELRLTIYIVALILCGCAYFLWVAYGPVKRFLFRHWTIRMYYRKVNQVVLDHDFYLINDFKGKTAGAETFHIDHVIIGNKYVYVVRDRFYDGTLLSNPDDQSWLYCSGSKSRYIQNPLIYNRLRAERLRLLGPIDSHIILPVVLVNDDCFYTPFEQSPELGYFVSLRQFPKFIDRKESEPIAPIDPDMAKLLAEDVYSIKMNNRNEP